MSQPLDAKYSVFQTVGGQGGVIGSGMFIPDVYGHNIQCFSWLAEKHEAAS